MVQLTTKDFERMYSPLISKNDQHRVLNSFIDMKGLPKDLNTHKNPIMLGPGMPHENLFPFEEIQVKIRDSPASLSDSSYDKVASSITTLPLSASGDGRVGIDSALQYNAIKGMPQMLDLTRQIISRINKPAYEDWDTIITCGSSDSLAKICQVFFDSDSVMLLEEFTFTNILPNVHFSDGQAIPLKINITSDAGKQGINVEYMIDLLENWSTYHPHKNKPKCLYTIATGQNPTGLTQSMENRQKIYDICCKHNIIIIEDDPYGYLKLPEYDPEHPMANPYLNHEYTVEQYCKDILSPSYMTIDTEGRVLRCESFSKVASPGLRLSFVAGNKYLIDQLLKVTSINWGVPSGLSQGVFINTLIDMGHKYQTQPGHDNAPLIDGWIEWCMKIAGQYTDRRNSMFKYIYEQPMYKNNLVKLIEPSCGMFVSLVINLKPEWSENNIKRVMDYLFCCLLEEGCVAVLGYKMTADRDFSMERANFIRCTVATASDEEVFKIGAERFNKAVERLFSEYGVDEKFTLAHSGFD